ncbi:auxilin-like protein 1 [Iris pallida]|uniref:Auxilin-like protein 1 n=1 Tax=Iris pallida TaxID=29817 RepID=A0AAX6E9W5_IRIPA|nr:auxilin-like protein 1 [Iris pallida]
MADPRSSRRHGHGHGGSTKQPAQFTARSDYGDVFGGVAGSCSIPFLDLPPQPDVCDEMGPLDYTEIFGGFRGSDFAVDYEELFGKKNNSNGRILKETEVGRQAEDTSDVHGEGAWGGKNHLPLNSEHSDDGSRQFNMSFHKTNHRSIEDTSSGTTYVTHLHAVTGYTDMIDSFSPLHGTETDNPPKVVKNDHIHIVSSHGGLPDENQANITFPGDCKKSFGAELKTQQKQFTNRYPTGEDGPANVRHHSRSSSNHSSSSGDVSLPDVAFVTISDINLRTEPSRVPPPSRAPPKLVSKQGLPKMNIYGSFKADLEEGSLPKTMGNRQTHYSLGVSKGHLINKGLKDGSPSFFDVEVDASSAAAASAAAMKEAMEQAQARLKSAKELMERKRENAQSRKKMGQQEVMKCDERPEDKTVEKVKCLSEVKTQKTLLEEEGSTKQFSFKARENVIGTAKEGTTDVKERCVVSSGEDQEIMQGHEFKTTPSVPYELEVPGVWKADKEFYELVKSENNSKMVKEVHKQEGFEKNQKIATKVNEYTENDVKQAELSCEFGRNGRLQKVEETSDRKEDNFIYGNMAVYEKIREIPNTILKACAGIENVNKFQEVHDSLQRRGNEKELAVQVAQVSEHEQERSNAIKGCAAGDYASRENKKSDEPCGASFEFDRDTRGEEKERKLEVAEKPCGCDNNEKELVGDSVSGVTLETKKRQNKVGGAGMQAQSHMYEIVEQLEAVDEAYQCESHQNTRKDNKSAYSHEESGCECEDTTSAPEEEIQRLNRTEKSGFCLQQSQVIEGTNKCEADLVILEAVQGTFEQRECEESTNLTEEVGLQGSEEIKAREVKEEIHQDEKQQKSAPAIWEKDNCEEARISEEGLKERVTEKVGGGVHMSSDFEEMHEVSVEGQHKCQRAVDKEAENIQQASLLGEKANVQNSVPDDIELCPVNLRSLAQDNIGSHQIYSQSPAQVDIENHHTVLTENAMPDMHKPEKREHARRNKKEQEKEQARNLDEEKEREREREKDRLAVERATSEAHERALTEARERAERIAVERITAEARQRAMAEAREKSEKASAEALEKSLADKASKEAKLKAERAAVERATAEARERAVEKALAEKAASDARQRAERSNAASRDSRGNDREDGEINPNPSFAGMQNVPRDARFRSASSSSSLKNTDFHFQGNGDSPLRCKARLERHQRTFERAAKALAEKNMRDILAQREQAERNRLAESLDADVRRWSTGKEGNLRALLSTLQYILGPDSGWQPIPLTDVITAVGVKKAYRKATLCVHPDKLQQRGASIRQKYICEKVFDLLKEAWSSFNSEER